MKKCWCGECERCQRRYNLYDTLTTETMDNMYNGSVSLRKQPIGRRLAVGFRLLNSEDL